MTLVCLYTPRTHQEISGFLMFSGVLERDQWQEIAQDCNSTTTIELHY